MPNNKTFEDVLFGFGILVNGHIPADGAIHRYATIKSPQNKSAWAVKFPDSEGGIYGDFKMSNDDGIVWFSGGRKYSDLSLEHRARLDAIRENIARQKIEAQEQVALCCVKRWQDLADATGEEPYLLTKAVAPHGVKSDAEGILYVPLRDATGKLWNIQSIAADGSKRFKYQGKKQGCFHLIEGDKAKTILCEGYATGASIRQATGFQVLVCFDAGNLKEVARTFKGNTSAVVAADHDHQEKGGKGQKTAQEIKDLYGVDFVLPNREGADFNDLMVAGEDITAYFFETIEAYSIAQYIADDTPMPDDLIAPRVLVPNGMVVFGGAPKVGKSDFVLSWLMHMAGGVEFMGMKPSKPLRVFYLQAEIGKHYLKERIDMVNMPLAALSTAERNMVVTPRLRMLLDANGVEKVGNTIRKMGGCDIIAIDPLRNLFDGISENDNAEMLKFLQGRIEALRPYSGTDCGIIVVHHTKKVAKDELMADPFLAFSGASSLRGFYNTGMLMYRPDEESSERVLAYELRDGRPLDNVRLDKVDGKWTALPKNNRLPVTAASERERKMLIIKQTIREGDYSANKLSEFLAGKENMGAARTIRNLIQEMLTQGEIATLHESTILTN